MLNISPKACVQLSNVFHTAKVLQNFSHAFKACASPDTFNVVSESVFSTVALQLEQAIPKMMTMVTDKMQSDVEQALTWFTQTDPKDQMHPADALFATLNFNLAKCNTNCDEIVFKKVLRAIFSMMVNFIGQALNAQSTAQSAAKENLGTLLLDLFTKKKLSARELSKRLGELTEDLCTWAEGNGAGLPEEEINETVRLLRIRLQFWAAPTKDVIDQYQHNVDFVDVSKEELLGIIKSRREEDQEAKDFYATTEGKRTGLRTSNSILNFFKKLQ